jgi:nicotinate-nucleotide adenylyltransferase
MLQAIRCQYSPGSEFYFIIGSDAFLELPSWKAYRQVLARTNIILARRSGHNNRQLVSFLRRVGYRLRQGIWCYPDGGRRLFFLAATPEEISSSAVRARLQQGETVADWVPEEVVAYIAAHALYRPETDKEMAS